MEINSRIQSIVAMQVKSLMDELDYSSRLIETSRDIFFTLELIIPMILAEKYSEWQSETIDGFLECSGKLLSPTEVEIYGSYIAMSSQNHGYFLLRLALDTKREIIECYNVSLSKADRPRKYHALPQYEFTHITSGVGDI